MYLLIDTDCEDFRLRAYGTIDELLSQLDAASDRIIRGEISEWAATSKAGDVREFAGVAVVHTSDSVIIGSAAERLLRW